MKKNSSTWPACRLFYLSLPIGIALLAASVTLPAAVPQSPLIESVQRVGTNAILRVRVPSGLRKITVESRDRLGAGPWEPRQVQRLDGSGASITVNLPSSRPFEVLRVRADETEPLPASFYAGTNQFFGQTTGTPGFATPGLLDTVATPGGTDTDPTRAVVESDIWKRRGNTLFFFNQLRGLQVIDVTDPDAASIRGVLPLPAAGEDLYLLGDAHVILLARSIDCSSDGGRVLIVSETNGTPSLVAQVPVAGYIQESRLVGTALYIASQTYRPVQGTTNSVWEWGTIITGIDLADPAAPVAREPLWFSGYGNVVTATDRLLFVVTQDVSNWWQSTVHCIDITAPDGTLHDYVSIPLSGRVPDKFKINWDGAVLTTISEDWRSVPGRTLTTRLETFRLPDPRAVGPRGVSKLGQLELGHGEQLRATRFDGQRVYVVTFYQIDPLWVVDLSDATAPRIAGSVAVPGWSTFIQPVDSRLVTLGIESNHVSVSLFDVADPAKPALLSRVRLGENYSWSSANWDEKAFTVLADDRLILVPYDGDTTNGYATRVQLIDLNPKALVARGVIEHRFQPLRVMPYGGRILSLSGPELLSVDVENRDLPVVRGTTTLAWGVDQVFVVGNYLLQIGFAGGWRSWTDGTAPPVVRVSTLDSPDQILGQLVLSNLPVVGADVHEGQLYLAQTPQGWAWPVPLAGDGADPVDLKTNDFLLTIVRLDNLPALTVAGQTSANVGDTGFGSQFQAVWPRPGTLVWVGGGFNYWWWDVLTPVNTLAMGIRWNPWSGGRLTAFDVQDTTAPRLASSLNLSSSNGWNFSQAFAADGLLYLSHQTSEFLPQPLDGTASPGGPLVKLVGPIVIDPNPPGSWTTRYFLDVVDYTVSAEPLVRQPVSIPGGLKGVSGDGALLYTVGVFWTTNQNLAWTESLAASAYDGTSAHLVDSLLLSESWSHPVLVTGTNVFVGDTVVSPSNQVTAYLETWALSTAGRLEKAGQLTLPAPVASLSLFGSLLAVPQMENSIALFDASDGANLRVVGGGRPPGCLWTDLSRADGDVKRGLWLPLGAYGTAQIGLKP